MFSSRKTFVLAKAYLKGTAEITEIVLDWSCSICRRSDAVLPGQINKEVDLRPEATDGAFLGDQENQSRGVANQDSNRQQSSYSAFPHASNAASLVS